MRSLNILKNNIFFFTAGLSSALLLTWCLMKLQEFTRRKRTDSTSHSRNKDHLRILIIGGPNSGKTSTLKYLAGHNITGAFSNFPNLEFICNDDVYGWKIFAVKCKHVSASLKLVDDEQIFFNNLKDMLKLMEEFHIVIYCLSLKNVTRKNPMEYILILNKVLEPQIINNHVVLAITIDEDFEVPQNEFSFNSLTFFLNNEMLRTILTMFKNRWFSLHIKTSNERRKREEIMRFLSMCQDIVLDNASLALSKAVETIQVHEECVQIHPLSEPFIKLTRLQNVTRKRRSLAQYKKQLEDS